MALLFAEGITVLLEDPSEENVNSVLATARQDDLEGLLEKHQGYGELCKNLDSPKVPIFSLPHGTVGDSVVEGLLPYLEKGDVIIDASNEHGENTLRRQGKLVTMGVFYVGKSSISACSLGGRKKQSIHNHLRHGCFWRHQAVRRGPSMCPGEEDAALDLVLPRLEKVSAKDGRGKACVGRVGMGGAGPYVKMIHNGIEHGIMSALVEAWQI